MKRSLYILPLMTFTALSLTLAGCDDKKTEEAPAPVEQSSATPEAVPEATPETAPQTPVETPPEVTPPAAITPLAMPPADAPFVEKMPPAAAPLLITASNPRAYATAEGAKTGAVFVTLHNSQNKADKLIGAKTGKTATVEMHESSVDSGTGTMQMKKVSSIEIPAGGTLELKPGGYHIMLMNLTEPLVAGQSFDMILTFESGNEAILPVSIISPTAAAAPAVQDHDSHAHGVPEAPAAQEPATHEHPAE